MHQKATSVSLGIGISYLELSVLSEFFTKIIFNTFNQKKNILNYKALNILD